MPPPPKISIKQMLPTEALLFQPPDGKEDAYVMLVVDPAHNIFTATQVSNKTVYTFRSTDMVIKLEALDAVPPLPSSVIGAKLLLG